MASGVKVCEECFPVFEEVKMNIKGQTKRLYTVLRMNSENTEIVLDKDFDDQLLGIKDFKALLAKLPTDDGRYVIFDYGFKSKAGADSSKLILLSWVPSGLSVKKKMLYSTSKDAVKKMINGEVAEFQCDGPDDITDDDVIAKVKK